MRAVGEVMSIGKTYKEAFQKAIRSLENSRYGLGFTKDFHEKSLDELMQMLNYPTSERHFVMYEALREGADAQELYKKTFIKPWFIQQMKELVDFEEKIVKYKGKKLPDNLLAQAKKDGFADRYLAKLLGLSEEKIREQRINLKVVEAWDYVPVSGTENVIETEADALADGENVFIPAVMEHIEYAGVHSGDAACVIPPVSILQKHINTIEEYTRRIARELKVVGVMNIQYAICP